MEIREESADGVTLALDPEEARRLVAGLEGHPVGLGEAAANLRERLKAVGVETEPTAEEELPSPNNPADLA